MVWVGHADRRQRFGRQLEVRLTHPCHHVLWVARQKRLDRLDLEPTARVVVVHGDDDARPYGRDRRV